ncbi:MAG TPA: EutN/CcmL family microcompartment protein [Halanaerobiales bacterium]|nr:EutN/CcmL family microcompartment protein [Halanaerobiales bacterium]
MFVGEVVGNMVATRKNEKLTGSKLLVVKPFDNMKKSTDGLMVAVDLVGAGIGEEVLVVTGSSARVVQDTADAPVDAAIVGIVDNIDIRE